MKSFPSLYSVLFLTSRFGLFFLGSLFEIWKHLAHAQTREFTYRSLPKFAQFTQHAHYFHTQFISDSSEPRRRCLVFLDFFMYAVLSQPPRFIQVHVITEDRRQQECFFYFFNFFFLWWLVVCQSPNNSALGDNYYHTAVETAKKWKIAGSLETSEVEER